MMHPHLSTVVVSWIALVCAFGVVLSFGETFSYTYQVYQDGTSGTDVGYGVTLDESSGKYYITGYSDAGLYGTAYGSDDIFVAAFNSDSSLSLSQTFGTSESEQGRDILLDTRKNLLYVCGSTEGSLFATNPKGASNAYVMALNPSGLSRAWGYQFADNDDSSFTHLALDPTDSGAIYVIGNTQNSYPQYSQTLAGSQSYFIVKFTNVGSSQPAVSWVRLLGASIFSQGRNIGVDQKGYVYVCGFALGSVSKYHQTNNGETDIMAAKLDSTGNFLWVKLIGGPDIEDSWWIAFNSHTYGTMYIAADTSGNFTYNGSPVKKEDKDSIDNVMMISLDMSAGNVNWVTVQGVDSFGAATPAALFFGNDSNLYVSGFAKGEFEGQSSNDDSEDVFFAVYNSLGYMQYVHLMGSTSTETVYGMAFNLANNNAFIIGSTTGSFGANIQGDNPDVFVEKAINSNKQD